MTHPPRDPITEIDDLRRALASLEGRVAALEGHATPVADIQPIEEAGEPAVAGPSATGGGVLANSVAYAGRSLLFLGGAFLLRALTEGNLLSRPVGTAAGLLYAFLLVAILARGGARASRLSAAFHGVTAALVAYPLLWETTAHFKLLAPAASAGALVVVTGGAFLVAAIRNLPLLGWIYSLAAVVTGMGLLVATSAVELYGGALVLVGLGTLVLGITRGWYAVRWPVALAADIAVLFGAALVARAGGPPDAYRGLSPAGMQALCFGLAVTYLAAFAVQMLRRRREAGAFEAAQTLAVLAIGLGGAARIGRAGGGIEALPGIVAILVSVAGYILAFTFVDRRLKVRRSFYYFAWLGLAALFVGIETTVTGAALLTALLCLFALACAWLGARYRRVTLRIHSAVYVAAAAAHGGLAAAAWSAFRAPPDGAWPSLAFPPLLVAAAAGVSFALLARSRHEPGVPWHRHVPRLVHAVILIAGIGLLAVRGLTGLLTEPPPEASGGMLALVRTVVVSASAIVLTLAGRRGRFVELAWLVYPVLVIGALKLLFEDLRRGEPGTLFLGLACYGAALIVAARVARR